MKGIVDPQKELEAMEAFRKGDRELGNKLQDEFLEQFRQAKADGKDHCSCRKPCKHHGNCVECIAIHRAHRDHIPNCLRNMVNEQLKKVSGLTEHTVLDDGDENIHK